MHRTSGTPSGTARAGDAGIPGIEPLAARHMQAIRSLAADPELTRTSSVPNPCTEGDVEAWIADNAAAPRRTLNFAILHEGQVAGMVTLKRLDAPDGSGELSFWVGRAHRGRGLAKAAGRLAIRHGFEALGLSRVVAHYLAAGNPPSGRTLAALGFRPDPGRADLPVADRFAEWFPGDAWRFVTLDRPRADMAVGPRDADGFEAA